MERDLNRQVWSLCEWSELTRPGWILHGMRWRIVRFIYVVGDTLRGEFWVDQPRPNMRTAVDRKTQRRMQSGFRRGGFKGRWYARGFGVNFSAEPVPVSTRAFADLQARMDDVSLKEVLAPTGSAR